MGGLVACSGVSFVRGLIVSGRPWAVWPRLKIGRPKGRVSSTLTSGTIPDRASQQETGSNVAAVCGLEAMRVGPQ